MKRVFIGFIICLLLNCSKKENTIENTPYIMSKKDIITNISNKPKDKNIPPPPPIPGWLFYGTNTFIIDKDSKIYYSQREKIGRICGYKFDDTIPHFINLQPKDLIEIPNNMISDFIKLNYKDNFQNITFIASTLDTLKTQNYFDLINAIESSLDQNDSYFIRRTTQEEDTVFKYKKNNEYYNSENIKWDKKRITFPFIKPKL
ncbi:hypothetical protein [Flavobacterium hydrophilum]|uniref:Uncharacterized protein n=1 Tax=Flavobacterium hydrophilum TaxID=2211445 RepID=A0A2V4C206_9FLAO|nr:hypothetical protein [Flavobacterium hydrophilum]PXY45341.1 hypothetical protein DMB68_11710 [Flavobacterium hydrophilum]